MFSFPPRSTINNEEAMNVSRRQFFKICAGGMAGTTVAALGFAPKMALAQARNYKHGDGGRPG
jgi:formate dehydrogenase-N alpha subunit